MKKARIGGGEESPVAEVTEEHVSATEQDELVGLFEFPKEHHKALNGLVFLGYLEDTLTFAGHTFVVHTLNEGEFLLAGNLIREYDGSVGYQKAYKIAIVSCAVKSVDGQPLYQSLSPSEAEHEQARRRFDVVKQWYPVVTDAVYRRFELLDQMMTAVVKDLGES